VVFRVQPAEKHQTSHQSLQVLTFTALEYLSSTAKPKELRVLVAFELQVKSFQITHQECLVALIIIVEVKTRKMNW